MGLKSIEDEVAKIFSLSKVSTDFLDYLTEEGLGDGEQFRCTVDGRVSNFDSKVKFEIVTRVAQFNYSPISSEVRVLIAVGGIACESNGVAEAVHFFAKIYYGDDTAPNRIDMDSCQFAL